MSVDKYAQFIAEQQRKLSVSGTNAVDIDESWSRGASSSNYTDKAKMRQYRQKAKGFLETANGLPKDSRGHAYHMAQYHAAKAKEVKHAFHANEYMSKADAKKEHDEHMAQSKEYRQKYNQPEKTNEETSLEEKKELSPKQKKIAKQAGDPEKIEGEDFAKLRAKNEEVEQIVEKERTAAELKDKIKQHSLGHHATPETNWRKKKKHLQATSAAERLLAKLPRSKGGESVTKQGIRPVGVTKTQWKNKKWNEEVELDLADRDIGY